MLQLTALTHSLGLPKEGPTSIYPGLPKEGPTSIHLGVPNEKPTSIHLGLPKEGPACIYLVEQSLRGCLNQTKPLMLVTTFTFKFAP